MIIKKLLQLIFVAFATVSTTTAQEPVIESFDYDVGALDGLGAAENGWGGPWAFVGNTENVNIVEGSLENGYLTTSGNKLVINATEGTHTGGVRELATTWEDVAGNVYWISFLFEVENPDGITDSWQGMSLDLPANTEQGYIGKLWGMDELGINDPNPYLNVPSTVLWSDGLVWFVVKIVMSGDDGIDNTYLWINPDPSTKPTDAYAAVNAEININEGFNAIRCHLGQTEGLIVRFDEIRLGTAWADVIPAGTNLTEIVQSDSRVNIYPNPFSDVTTINYELSSPQTVKLEIYNVIGERVKTLANSTQAQGVYNINWVADDQPEGIYFYRLQIGSCCETGKLVMHR
jgi:hypothetical protein